MTFEAQKILGFCNTYTPDSSLTTMKLKENKQATEDMTFLNWSPCLLIRFTSQYYILPNGCV
jgi:hypothetical protein